MPVSVAGATLSGMAEDQTVLWAVTVDCADPGLLAAFWETALGYRPADPPTGFDSWEQWFEKCEVPEEERNDGATIQDPAGRSPQIGFLKVPEGKTVKNRWHLDLKVSGGRAQPPELRTERIEAKVAALLAAGASELLRGPDEGPLDHVTMADPEGNEFCVV